MEKLSEMAQMYCHIPRDNTSALQPAWTVSLRSLAVVPRKYCKHLHIRNCLIFYLGILILFMFFQRYNWVVQVPLHCA